MPSVAKEWIVVTRIYTSLEKGNNTAYFAMCIVSSGGIFELNDKHDSMESWFVGVI